MLSKSQAYKANHSLIIRKEEVLLCGTLTICLLLCLCAGGELALPGIFLTYLYFIASQCGWLLAAAGISALVLKRASRSFSGVPKQVLGAVFGERREWQDLGHTFHEVVRGILIFAFSLTVYTNVKVRVPILNPEIGDGWFADLDQMLFGDLPSRLESWAKQSSDIAEMLGNIYFSGYRGVAILGLFLVIRCETRVIRVLFIAMSLTYIVCILVTLVYPSLGPCFFDNERFGWIQDSNTIATQQVLLNYRDHVDSCVNSGVSFVPVAFLGIAAFPSLHVANLFVVTILSARYCKLALPIVLYYLAGTMISATAFGWHYMIDFLGGAAIALACTTATEKLVQSPTGMLPKT